MTEYEFWLAAGCVLTAIWARALPRALLWLAVIAASFAVSSVYWRTSLPYPVVFAGVCDAITWLAIYAGAKRKWEMRLGNIVQAMLLINIVYGALPVYGVQVSAFAYGVLLDVCNWAALFLIGGTASMQMAGAYGTAFDRRSAGFLHRLGAALHAERKEPPWWRAP